MPKKFISLAKITTVIAFSLLIGVILTSLVNKDILTDVQSMIIICVVIISLCIPTLYIDRKIGKALSKKHEESAKNIKLLLQAIETKEKKETD